VSRAAEEKTSDPSQKKKHPARPGNRCGIESSKTRIKPVFFDHRQARSLTDLQQRQQNVYAGVAYDSKQFPYPTSAGPLCEWTVKTTDKWAESATFEEYQSSLVLACEPGQSVNLTWTVPMDAPKTLYYQCYSHNALGWKINVENPGFRASPAVSPTPALGVAFSLVVALVTLARS